MSHNHDLSLAGQLREAASARAPGGFVAGEAEPVRRIRKRRIAQQPCVRCRDLERTIEQLRAAYEDLRAALAIADRRSSLWGTGE